MAEVNGAVPTYAPEHKQITKDDHPLYWMVWAAFQVIKRTYYFTSAFGQVTYYYLWHVAVVVAVTLIYGRKLPIAREKAQYIAVYRDGKYEDAGIIKVDRPAGRSKAYEDDETRAMDAADEAKAARGEY